MSLGRTTTVQVRLQPSEKKKLEKIARSHELRVSELIRFWVRAWGIRKEKSGAARWLRAASQAARGARSYRKRK